MINIISSGRYKINRKLIRETFRQENHNLNIIFVGRIKIKQISKKYLKDEIIHPILSFFYSENNLIEIFICYPQIILLAAEKNKKIDQMIIQLIHHGIKSSLS